MSDSNIKDSKDANVCFPVYSMRLAGFLMQRGFVLFDIAPNIKNLSKNVFYFKESIQIQQAINEYLKRK